MAERVATSRAAGAARDVGPDTAPPPAGQCFHITCMPARPEPEQIGLGLPSVSPGDGGAGEAGEKLLVGTAPPDWVPQEGEVPPDIEQRLADLPADIRAMAGSLPPLPPLGPGEDDVRTWAEGVSDR